MNTQTKSTLVSVLLLLCISETAEEFLGGTLRYESNGKHAEAVFNIKSSSGYTITDDGADDLLPPVYAIYLNNVLAAADTDTTMIMGACVATAADASVFTCTRDIDISTELDGTTTVELEMRTLPWSTTTIANVASPDNGLLKAIALKGNDDLDVEFENLYGAESNTIQIRDGCEIEIDVPVKKGNGELFECSRDVTNCGEICGTDPIPDAAFAFSAKSPTPGPCKITIKGDEFTHDTSTVTYPISYGVAFKAVDFNSGNGMVKGTVPFQVIIEVLDPTPVLDTTVPSTLSMPMAAPSTLVLTYNQKITAGTVSPLILDSDGDDLYDGTIANDGSVSESTMTITVDSTYFKVGRDYLITLPAAFVTSCSEDSEEESFSFCIKDTGAAPVISTVSPADTTTTNDIPTSIVITFDKEIEKSAGTTPELTISSVINTTPEVLTIPPNDNSVVVDSDAMTVTVTQTLAADSVYTVNLPEGFVKYCSDSDSDGLEWSFCVSVPTAVNEGGTFSPMNGGVVPLTTDLMVTFDQMIYKGNSNTFFTVNKVTDGSPVFRISALSSRVVIDEMSVTIKDVINLESNEHYYVTIDNGFLANPPCGSLNSEEFISLGKWEFCALDFRIKRTYPDIGRGVADVIVSKNPKELTLEIEFMTKIRFIEMNPVTAAFYVFESSNNRQVAKVFSTSVDVQIHSQSTLSVTIVARLLPHRTYYIKIDEGFVENTDDDCLIPSPAIDDNFTWKFLTTARRDPAVSAIEKAVQVIQPIPFARFQMRRVFANQNRQRVESEPLITSSTVQEAVIGIEVHDSLLLSKKTAVAPFPTRTNEQVQTTIDPTSPSSTTTTFENVATPSDASITTDPIVTITFTSSNPLVTFTDSAECQCFLDEALVSIANGYNINFDTALKGDELEYYLEQLKSMLLQDEDNCHSRERRRSECALYFMKVNEVKGTINRKTNDIRNRMENLKRLNYY